MYNLKTILQEKVDDFNRKYKGDLTYQKYEYLNSYNHKIADFIKLSKSKRFNEIIAQNPISKTSEILDIEGLPIVEGSVYYTLEMSILIHKIMETSLTKISHILKDTFDFTEKNRKKFWKFQVFLE